MCNKKFATIGGMKTHIKTAHLDKREYKCETCEKSFNQLTILKGHIERVHENVKSYKCEICEKEFALRTVLLQHIKERHENMNTPKEICPFCNKQFITRLKFLQEHIENVHKKTKEYQCDLCDKKFGRSGSLLGHQKTIHSNETFTCIICNKSLRKSFYKRHMRIHEKMP